MIVSGRLQMGGLSFHNFFSMLKGSSITLRTAREKDLPEMLGLMSDMDNRGPYFPMNMPTETSLRTRYNKDGFWSADFSTLLIVDKESDRILGSVAFFKPVFYLDTIEIGYILYDKESRGKGIMPQAVRLLSRYLFGATATPRLQLQIDKENAASRRVAEKCGFKYEGTAREAMMHRGALCDMDTFALLRSDWERERPSSHRK